MKITRTLRKNSSGEDVRWLKDWLFRNGFYLPKIKKITHDRYGTDTVNAVKAFQRKYSLNVDGIFGPKSREMLENILNPKKTKEYLVADEYPRISEENRKRINAALNSGSVTDMRRKVVLEVLKYATDASVAKQYRYPISLYIRGGNLYNKDLTLNTITEKYLTGTYKKKYASYCTNGRLDLMVGAVKHFLEKGIKITGADCSGGVIGVFRKFGMIKANTDATANGLLGSGYSKVIKKDELILGDLVGKSGHICIYVGGGLMVEWAGGEYGCQLTQLSDRRCWSFTKRRMVKMSACNKYRRPKMY
ncbi:MAG: peptidoglycan-binding protein [Christensenellaceae bacterium]|nr:peptidoglycan-binding protein [Christensenellaceae bacterium]